MSIGSNISAGITLGRPVGPSGSWLALVKPDTGGYRIVAYSSTLAQWLIASTSGALWTSDNGGSTWTSRTVPVKTYRSAVWSPELNLWVVLAQDGGAQQVITSPDGVTWTARNTPAVRIWTSVAWNGSVFVAVALDVNSQRMMTSPDGINWTLRTGPVTLRSWNRIVWAPALGLFVAVAQANNLADAIVTTPDGITWTLRTTPAPGGLAPDWKGLDWSPTLGLFVAVGFPGGLPGSQIMTSPDAINWTLRTVPSLYTNVRLHGIAWSEEKRVFVSTVFDDTTGAPPLRSLALWSTDGINWNRSRTPAISSSTNGYGYVAWGNPFFVAVNPPEDNPAGAAFMRSRTGR